MDLFPYYYFNWWSEREPLISSLTIHPSTYAGHGCGGLEHWSQATQGTRLRYTLDGMPAQHLQLIFMINSIMLHILGIVQCMHCKQYNTIFLDYTQQIGLKIVPKLQFFSALSICVAEIQVYTVINDHYKKGSCSHIKIQVLVITNHRDVYSAAVSVKTQNVETS